MKIAIFGTRGIPNNYGGFEQFAEYLAAGLVRRGHQVVVYNSHDHPYQMPIWNGVTLVHKYDPEHTFGTVGQFIYDFNCILDVRQQKCDVVLQLGYTSSSVWGWLLPKHSIITTNMDGLEWKRTKYSNKVKLFLKYAEKLGVKYSDHLISDSIGIKDYLKEKYNSDSTYIPYGANLFNEPDEFSLNEYCLKPYSYDMLIARLEPENSIEIILDGVVKAGLGRPFLVVGNDKTTYGDYLKDKYNKISSIKFIGGIYDINRLNNLRYFSNLYFHGHTVGGTNPSLLEAMASHSLICANKNNFNQYILGNDALYFETSENVAAHLITQNKTNQYSIELIGNNLQKITDIYNWENIIDQYEIHFSQILGSGKNKT